jgi:hypothetical protein
MTQRKANAGVFRSEYVNPIQAAFKKFANDLPAASNRH